MSESFPLIFQVPVNSLYVVKIISPSKVADVLQTSRMKSSIYFGSIQVAPSLTSISDAVNFVGCTFSNASTLAWNFVFSAANFFAMRSLSTTSPLRYSSAGSKLFVIGLTKTKPVSSCIMASSVLPVRLFI